jgi:hypothetical protein
MTREQALKRLRELPKFPPDVPMVGFLPSAVVEGMVGHLNPVQKLYTYVFKMGAHISDYQYTGNKIKVEVQVPFPTIDNKDMVNVAVYVELEPW